MKKKKKGWIIALILIVVVAVAGFAISQAGPKVTPVETGTAQLADLQEKLTCNGTLEAENGMDVYADSSVRVLDVLKDRDDAVKKGDPVLSLDLKDMKNQLAQAVISMENQKLAIEKLKNTDPLQETTALSVAVRQAEAALASDRLSLQRAQEDLAENKPLFEAGQISRAEYDQFVQAVEDLASRVKVSEMSLTAARANLDNAQDGNRDSASSRTTDIEMQENLLKTQELTVANLEETLASLQAASLAPMDGIVTLMNAETGGMLAPGTPVFRVDDLSHLEVKAKVKEYDAKRLSEGQTVTITGDGIPEEMTVTGTVSQVSRTAEKNVTTTGEEVVVPITIAVDADPAVMQVLKAGLSATCDIVTNARQNAVSILYSMLMTDEDGTEWVYQVQNGMLEKVVIETGINSDLSIEVVSGLVGGEELVINPAKTLTEGAQVVAKPK